MIKNISIYLSILLIIVSCNNYYKSAKNYYSLGQFQLAKSELAEINESNSDYNKAKLLNEKIDSIYYNLAFEKYSNNFLKKASNLLDNINSKSQYYQKRNILSIQILKKTDSIVYHKAFEEYSKGYLIRANNTILYSIYPKSLYYQKKVTLSKRILKKINHNSIKEKYISKAVISSIFGAHPSTIKVKIDDPGIFIVSYYSKFAGKSYSYKVKFENENAFWGADNGRWRDDNISYIETNNAYYIIEKYIDGSKRKDKFYKYKLK